jgi:uncharacterized protein (DUF58 family)
MSASPDQRKLCDPRTLARLRGLQLRARSVVEGYMSGVHRSSHHGFSVEFAQHREYVPGEDLRYVDWKVYGRTDKMYLKQYEESTNLVCYLLVDASESMKYRSSKAPMSKLEYAQCMAASLAYLILGQQDSVGLVTFHQSISALVQASGSPAHLKQLLHVMERTIPERGTNTGTVLHDLAERFRRRCVMVLLSDLLDDVAATLKGMMHLRYRQHDVIVFHVLDPAELEFPFDQLTLFKGLESRPEMLVEPAAVRSAYQGQLRCFLEEIRRGCRAQQSDYTLVRTDQPLDFVLSSYLASRMKKRT